MKSFAVKLHLSNIFAFIISTLILTIPKMNYLYRPFKMYCFTYMNVWAFQAFYVPLELWCSTILYDCSDKIKWRSPKKFWEFIHVLLFCVCVSLNKKKNLSAVIVQTLTGSLMISFSWTYFLLSFYYQPRRTDFFGLKTVLKKSWGLD